MLTATDFATSQKANVQALIDLSGKAMEGVESLVQLNLQTAKTALSDAQANSIAALSAKDPQALLALQASALQPSAESTAAYVRKVYDIATAMKAEFSKVVDEAATTAQSSFSELVETATKNAPAGSENGIALWKSAVATANNAFESIQKAAKQATDAAEANYTAVTEQAVKATKTKRA